MKVRSGVDDREATLVELGGEVKWTMGSETMSPVLASES